MCEEAIDAYVDALKILQKSCNFCDCLKDSLLRDRIVFGVRDNGVRKRLLQERSLDLSRCIDICRTHENTTSQMKLVTDTGEEVHRVEERRHFTNKRQRGRGQFRQQKQERTTFPTPTRPIVNCEFCGRQHERKKEMRPAWGQICSKCNKRNHFSRCCPPGAKTIKKNTNSTQNKSETHPAKQYEVTSFLSTDCELSTETCSKNV